MNAPGPRKSCPVPGCRKSIPANWYFCKDRNCQDRRGLARTALVEQQERREAMYRAQRQRAGAYINAWRRSRHAGLIRARDVAVLNNDRLRRERYEAALRDGTAELRALIREQRLDDRRVSIGAQLSLDRPIGHDSRRTLHDVVDAGASYLVPWHDPTGDAATLRCDEEEQMGLDEVAAWNEAHRTARPRPLQRPLLAPLDERSWVALGSPRKMRRSRRRPAGTTLFDHGKARNHGKRTDADNLTRQTMKELRRTPRLPASGG